jgi:hypothetical protein
LFAGFLLAFIGGMAAWHHFTKPAEPSYQGKTLTQWLTRRNDPDDVNIGYVGWSARTKAAVRHMGTNTIPLMMEWFKAEDGPVRSHMHGLLERFYPGKLWLSERVKRNMSGYVLFELEEKDVETWVVPQIAALTNSPNLKIQTAANSVLSQYWGDKAFHLAHPPKISGEIVKVAGFGGTNGPYTYRVYQKP